MDFIGLTSRCRLGCVPFGDSGGESLPGFVLLREAACIPWLVVPCSALKAGSIASLISL